MTTKSLALIMVSAIGLASILGSAAATTNPPAVPVLTGKYVFTVVQMCSPANYQASGTLTFDKDTGKVKVVQALVSGDPKTLEETTATTSYSNSASTLTLNTFTYRAFFGKLKNGEPENFMLIGVVSGCGLNWAISR